MHIVLVTMNYPCRARPTRGIFVEELVRAFARNGTKCTVINPLSLFDRRYGKFDPIYSCDKNSEENPVEIWRPRYLSASAKNLLLFNTDCITQYNFNRIVDRVISKIGVIPDMLYGHFLYPSGAAVVKFANKLKIPAIVAAGESNISDYCKIVSSSKMRRDFSKVDGMVAVSSDNKSWCEATLGIPATKIGVFPNGVNLLQFYPRRRLEMRKRFGLPTNKFIVAFVGHFIERKGPNRLLSAVSASDNIGVLLIGSGNMQLIGENVSFKAALAHAKIPEMLSAADIFVLPTLAEGSCNAIIEAMACGLPIVTSNGSFNDDIVDEKVAIRINPLNTAEIRNAIMKLVNDDDLRKRMSAAALKKSKQFDIYQRARNILQWSKEITTKSFQNGNCNKI